jgi:hypothetical protein
MQGWPATGHSVHKQPAHGTDVAQNRVATRRADPNVRRSYWRSGSRRKGRRRRRPGEWCRCPVRLSNWHWLSKAADPATENSPAAFKTSPLELPHQARAAGRWVRRDHDLGAAGGLDATAQFDEALQGPGVGRLLASGTEGDQGALGMLAAGGEPSRRRLDRRGRVAAAASGDDRLASAAMPLSRRRCKRITASFWVGIARPSSRGRTTESGTVSKSDRRAGFRRCGRTRRRGARAAGERSLGRRLTTASKRRARSWRRSEQGGAQPAMRAALQTGKG